MGGEGRGGKGRERKGREGKEGRKGRNEGKGREGRDGKEEMGGWEMNWMLVLAPHDHPGGQDRPGAIPGAPSPGAPCAVRVPELGALGRGREKKGKEGKGTGCHSRFPGRFWCPRAVWAPI